MRTHVGAGLYSPNPGSNGVNLRQPYVTLTQTIDVIIRKANEGRIDPAVRGWAGDALIAAGRPQTNTEKMVTLRREMQRVTVYAPDPIGAEFIVGAAGTLCLRPGLCVRAGDCDDMTVLLLSLGLSIGIRCQLVEHIYGGDEQPHVFVVFEENDGQGDYVYIDPITDWPVGYAPKAQEERWHDPLDYMSPEMVGVGGSAFFAGRHIVKQDGAWYERVNDQWYRWTGTGHVPTTLGPRGIVGLAMVGAGDTTSSYAPIASYADVKKGKRYWFAAVPLTSHFDAALSGDWTIEDQTLGAVKWGDYPSYLFRGIAQHDGPFDDTDLVMYLPPVYEEIVGDATIGKPGESAPSAPSAPISPPSPSLPMPAPPSPSEPIDETKTVNAPSVFIGAALGALAVGTVWGIYKYRRRSGGRRRSMKAVFA